ncbi:MAG: tryptophan 7-halogenase [Alphaproteobacteria bacterium]|nr:tryptophan 7-halogenase [Alphaproteobacteria bacterium]
MSTPPTVLIIGGGPAGASAAGVLAKAGAQVTVLERERFPRHHVGESLQPATSTLLDHHLGLGPALAEAGFAYKFGAVYVWGESREPWRVLFDPRLEAALPGLDEAGLLSGGFEHAWQVDRARFDQLILEAAAREGAEVRFGAQALGPLLEGERVVGLRLRLPSGEEREERADLVLDASGQSCVLGRALGLQEAIPDLRATATYAYYEGAGGVPGVLGRHVQLVVTVPEGWLWFIPTSAGRTSVGLVNQSRERVDLSRYLQVLADTPELPLEGAARLPGPQGRPLWFARDWSFTHTRFAGPGWMLLGDAACFVDPILSGGVDAAVRGGCEAALTVLRMYGEPGAEPEALLAAYDARTRRDFNAYLRLARYWYGNNRSVDGLFWQAHQELHEASLSTPMRAFVYLTTGQYAADRHLKVFQAWQEQDIFRSLGVDKGALARARRRRAT